MPVPGGVKAGKISKPYGLRGHVNIILNSEAGNYFEIDNPLFIDIDGQRVPFFVEEIDLGSGDQAIVKLEFLDSVDEARKICGCEVYFDPSKKPCSQKGDSTSSDFNVMIGYDASDLNIGYLGKVTDYIRNDLNAVLVVDHEGKELLIPAVEELIHRLDHKELTIQFHLPEGLTEV